MIEPWLLAIIPMTVFLVALALYANSQPTVLSREERERSEILEILRRIEATLNRESSRSPESSGRTTADNPAVEI